MVFLVIGAGFVAQLVDLQASRSGRSEELRALGESQRTKFRELAGYRGKVVDRDGFVLAVSTPSHQVIADPYLIKKNDPAETARLLAPILDMDVQSLEEKLEGHSEGSRWALIDRALSSDGEDRIEALREDPETEAYMTGIILEPQQQRVYPAAGLANPIVGRVDTDERGIYGVEAQYDELMAGIPGQMEFEASRFGSISVAGWKVDPATQGYDVVLALDHRIQFVAEEALRAQCEATGAAGATAVVSDPATGEILAMAGVARKRRWPMCCPASQCGAGDRL